MVAHFCSKFFIAEENLSIADLAGERPKNDEPPCEYVQRFREKALDCSETIPEKDLVKLCIKGMFAKYRVHIENHAIHDFAELSVKARNTEASASKLARLMRNHGDSSRQMRKAGKRGLEVAIAQDKKGSRFFKKEKREKPPEFPCSMEKVHALLDTSIKDKELQLPYVEKLPTPEEKQHAMYCRFHRRINHPTKECRKLRRIFKERFNNGEIILDQSSVEQTPFPQHQNEGAVMTCVFEEMSPTPLSGGTDGDEIFVNLAEPLLRTKLFKEFFDSLDFGESAQWEATNYLLSVAQRHGRNVVWLAIL